MRSSVETWEKNGPFLRSQKSRELRLPIKLKKNGTTPKMIQDVVHLRDTSIV